MDDGSSDGTWKQIQALLSLYPQVRGLRFTRNFGHQAAILAGLVAARGDAVIIMDSDGQHPPVLVEAFLERWRSGYQVVQALRRIDAHWSVKELRLACVLSRSPRAVGR